jgi:hypothetical protein
VLPAALVKSLVVYAEEEPPDPDPPCNAVSMCECAPGIDELTVAAPKMVVVAVALPAVSVRVAVEIGVEEPPAAEPEPALEPVPLRATPVAEPPGPYAVPLAVKADVAIKVSLLDEATALS